VRHPLLVRDHAVRPRLQALHGEARTRPGSSISIEYRYAGGDVSRLPGLAEELVRSGVDVIVARATAAIDADRRASVTIPIVMSAYPGDPVRDEIAKSGPDAPLGTRR
jgi:ABC-type uncharacterized transport system substrate-binding protein